MARSIGHRTVPDGWRNWDWDSSFPSVGQLNALLDGYLKRQQMVGVPGVVGGFQRGSLRLGIGRLRLGMGRLGVGVLGCLGGLSMGLDRGGCRTG